MSIIRGNNNETQISLLERLEDLPPEMFDMVWMHMLTEPIQPVQMKRLGTNPSINQVKVITPTRLRYVDDLITSAVFRLSELGASEDLVDRARKAVCECNTFGASSAFVTLDVPYHPLLASFALAYAPHVKSLQLRLDLYSPRTFSGASVSVRSQRYLRMLTNETIAKTYDTVRSVRFTYRNNYGLKLPRPMRLTFVLDEPSDWGEFHEVYAANPLWRTSEKHGDVCPLLRPTIDLLGLFKSADESLLRKHDFDWICHEWQAICQHSNCAMRNREVYAQLSSTQDLSGEDIGAHYASRRLFGLWSRGRPEH